MANPRRIEKLQREILRSIANTVLFELTDPRLSARITFTRVKLSRDLSHARIYYSVLGSEGQRATAQKALDHAKGLLRRQLGEVLATRIIPELEFVFDEAIAGSIEVSETLRQLEDERRALAGEKGEPVEGETDDDEAENDDGEADDADTGNGGDNGDGGNGDDGGDDEPPGADDDDDETA